MIFEMFLEVVRKCLQEKLGEEYSVEVMKVPQNNNGENKVILVSRICSGEQKVGSVIPGKAIYQEYQKGDKTIEECTNKLIEWFIQNEVWKKEEEIADITAEMKDWERIKGRLFPMLVSGAGNEKYLSRLLHRSFLDLEVIYFVPVEGDKVKGTVKVTKEMCRFWQLQEEEVYLQAMKNLKSAGSKLLSIETIVKEILGLEIGDEKEEAYMYVLTNEKKYYGAAGILNREFLQECAAELGRSFYLLPSSVHEMILVPDRTELDHTELKEMVREVNREHVAREEQLSDSVYYFDEGKEQLIMFT